MDKGILRHGKQLFHHIKMTQTWVLRCSLKWLLLPSYFKADHEFFDYECSKRLIQINLDCLNFKATYILYSVKPCVLMTNTSRALIKFHEGKKVQGLWLGQNKVNGLKFKLPSVTLANYGTAVPGKYGQIKKLQIVFTGRYEA